MELWLRLPGRYRFVFRFHNRLAHLVHGAPCVAFQFRFHFLPNASAFGRSRRAARRFRRSVGPDLPHGHTAAVIGARRQLRHDRAVAGVASPERERSIALIAVRILDPGSKLATGRGLAAATARDSLAGSAASAVFLWIPGAAVLFVTKRLVKGPASG